MDFIKAQLDRIQQQLAGLNASQKMLTAALVAIMLITVVWWGKYAGEAEMVPLVRESLSAEEIGRIQDVLSSKGIETQTSGDKIMVHADKRMSALGALTFARAMPRITDDGFKQMLGQMNPFDSVEKGNKIWNHHKQEFLSQVIGGIKGVVKADVIIDPTSNRRIDGNLEPSASVAISLEDGVTEKQKLVDAAAALLAGSQAGLNYNRITVVVNGVVQHVHDPEHDELGSSADQLEYREREEAYEEQKVLAGFHIRGLSVKVTVSLNTTSVLTEKKEYDGKGAVQKAIKTTEETDETTGAAAQAGGEAGVVPNIGLPPAPQAVASAGPGQTHSKNEEQFQVMVPETHITSKTPAGTPTTLGATVQVPYSYFVREFKQRNSGAKDPSDKDLQPLITSELGDMRKAVATLLAIASAEKVSINTYPDVTSDPDIQPVTAATGMAGVSLLVGAHAREIALGTLAVMSLFMATMMVRKSTPATVPAMPAGAAMHAPSATPNVLPGEALAGEATSGGAMLDGMELNEETIKAQQMVEQVSTLVRENPDAAASLVKRWLNRN